MNINCQTIQYQKWLINKRYIKENEGNSTFSEKVKKYRGKCCEYQVQC